MQFTRLKKRTTGNKKTKTGQESGWKEDLLLSCQWSQSPSSVQDRDPFGNNNFCNASLFESPRFHMLALSEPELNLALLVVIKWDLSPLPTRNRHRSFQEFLYLGKNYPGYRVFLFSWTQDLFCFGATSVLLRGNSWQCSGDCLGHSGSNPVCKCPTSCAITSVPINIY